MCCRLRADLRAGPRPGVPENEKSTGNLDGREECVEKGRRFSRQRPGNERGMERARDDVRPAIPAITQHSRQENHGDRSLHQQRRGQHESLSDLNASGLSCHQLPPGFRGAAQD